VTNWLDFTPAVSQSKYLSLEDDEAVPVPATGADRACPDCDYVSPPTAAYCARCRRSLEETA
jgi:hypothetical protein